MVRSGWLAFALTALCAGPTSLCWADEVDLPRNPSISPAGDEVAFSWRGDLWKVPSEGGLAVRLSAHPSSDLRSAYSPDGRWIAFNSRRDGNLNVWLMSRTGSELRQVTFSDLGVVLGQFAPGGESLTVHGRIEGDVYRASRPYLVPTAGGPLRRLHDAFGSEAALSPDGRFVAFTRGESSWSRRNYRGPDSRDVWLYDLAEARFVQITTWAGNDGMPHWAGRRKLLFVSDRLHERCNVFVTELTEDGAGRLPPLPLTEFRDRDVTDLDAAFDGTRAVCTAWDALYRIELSPAAGAARLPERIEIEAPADALDTRRLQAIDREVSEAALSPDGKTLAVIAYGEVFVRALGEHEPTRRVTHSPARERGLAWAPDGVSLYFSSDRAGGESIYAAEVLLTKTELKARYASATAPESSASVAGTQSGSIAAPDSGSPPAEAASSEDGNDDAASGSDEGVAGQSGGQAGDKGEGKPKKPRRTGGKKKGAEQGDKSDSAGKTDKEPDKADQGPSAGDRWADALRFQVSTVVGGESLDRDPSPSPCGKWLAFRRGLGELWLKDLSSGEERLFLPGWDGQLHWRWSPDGRWLAYSQQDRNFNSEVFLAPVDGSRPPVNVSMHPDDDYDPVWAADGKSLAFVSTRDGSADVYLLYLDRALEGMDRRELEAHYEAAGKALKARKPLEPGARAELPALELDLERAYLRLRRLTDWPGDESGLVIAPDGSAVYFSGSEAGDPGLYRIRWDGKDKKQLGGEARLVGSDLSGAKLLAIGAQRAHLIPSGGGKAEVQPVSAQLEIDEAALASQKFREAARTLGETFYHPEMKGLDWPALSERYHALAIRTRTPDEFSEVASRLIGELNASHLGISPPPERSPLDQPSGRLGVDLVPSEGGFRVLRVLPGGPAAQVGMRLEVGDLISEVERRAIEPSDTWEQLLRARVGDDTLFTVRRELPGRDQPSELLLLLRPISFRAESDLRYQAWTEERRAAVERASAGRIGYLHIRGMNLPSLVEFERDLYAAAYGKDALLIDVRNNGGGWTADRVLASLTARVHAYTVPRGADPGHAEGYPQGRLYIQRFTKPVNMLCNEKSFSNAEILSHAFKTLGRGTLVGEQTYGGVISTGGTTLVDGTRVRLPFRGWYLPDGTDMENNGAIPDLRIPQTPEDESADYDRQLERATSDLLERLPKR